MTQYIVINLHDDYYTFSNPPYAPKKGDFMLFYGTEHKIIKKFGELAVLERTGKPTEGYKSYLQKTYCLDSATKKQKKNRLDYLESRVKALEESETKTVVIRKDSVIVDGVTYRID